MDKQFYERIIKREFKRGFRTGFYLGIFVMGLFSLFLFIMTFIFNG